MIAHNKVIIVTGAGSGMGRDLTVQLTKLGAKVAMVDIHEDAMKETAALCENGKTCLHVLNIADQENVFAYPQKVIDHFGKVDGLINNAGIIQPFTDVNILSMEQIERVMNINFFGTLYMTKAFLPHLLKRQEAHIVNISSMGGFMPFPKQTIYGASKAAVKLLTEGLYAELKNTNVNVTVVYPGAIGTNIMSNSGLASKEDEEKSKSEQGHKVLPSDKAASIIINAMEKNKYRVLVGKDARMLDKFYRLAPRFAVNLIVKQMGKMMD